MIWKTGSSPSSSSCEWKHLLPGFTLLHSRTCRNHLYFKVSTLRNLIQLSGSVITLTYIKIEFNFIHTISKSWKVIKNCKGTVHYLFWPTEKKKRETTFRNHTLNACNNSFVVNTNFGVPLKKMGRCWSESDRGGRQQEERWTLLRIQISKQCRKVENFLFG